MNNQPFKIRDLRKKEQFIIDDVFVDSYAKLMSPYASLVYMSLCRHADKKQGAFPSIKRMAEQFHISPKSIKKGVKDLQDLNIIKKQRLGKRLSNQYWLLDKSEWKSEVKAPLDSSQKNYDGSVGAKVMALVETNAGSPGATKDAQVNDPHKKDNYGYKGFLERKKQLANKLGMK